MENREQQILSEIKSLMSSVRMQLEQLDAKMAELQQIYEPQELDMEPIDLDLEVIPMEVDDDLPFEIDLQSGNEETIEESVEETPVQPEELFMTMEDLPASEAEVEKEAPKPVAVIDLMATRHAWRTDMPGTQVKDIRAAIALVDRALFINRLFGEDAMAFMDTLNHINQLDSLDEAVGYLAENHPEWDFDSDVVYRFMMAVRRKIS